MGDSEYLGLLQIAESVVRFIISNVGRAKAADKR
jgi:hypothetical protein